MVFPSGVFARIHPDREEIPQSRLNIENKTRSNPLGWRGQFSPQLVQVLLDEYASPGTLVLDPFVGSGTCLLEAARKQVAGIGCEINPAAVALAGVYRLANETEQDRTELLREGREKLLAIFGDPLPLFRESHEPLDPSHFPARIEAWRDSVTRPNLRLLIDATVILADLSRHETSAERLLTAWARIDSVVRSLPHSGEPISVLHSDARAMPLPDHTVDLVITSPPYINVFNYHQQYRTSAELLHWDILRLARSEIGANRKHRSNRMLTVIQYCLDMTQVLAELWRVSKPGGKAILVVGRESNVKGTPFYNGAIVAELAETALGLPIELRQERVFTNRFGTRIYEDILHVSFVDAISPGYLPMARGIAGRVLQEALHRSPADAAPFIEKAIDEVETVRPSPLLARGLPQ